jgi:hypothetical protein
VLGLELLGLLFLEGVERVAAETGGFDLWNSSDNRFCREISEFLSYLIPGLVVVSIFVGTGQDEFLRIVDALLMISSVSS